MGGLIDGLGDLLKSAEEPETEGALAAMDAAMQEAIDRRAAETAQAIGDDCEQEPRVTVVRPGGGSTFGRRGGE